MSRRSPVRNLRARLLKSRAVSLCLGRRSFFLRPLDLPRGRPSLAVQSFLDHWKRPFKATGEYEDEDTDAMLEQYPLSVIVPECVAFLEDTSAACGWFEVEERAELLGTPATIHVRTFDLLVTAGSILDGTRNSCIFARDGSGELSRRGFVPMIGPAPRQTSRVRQIQDVPNFSEVANG